MGNAIALPCLQKSCRTSSSSSSSIKLVFSEGSTRVLKGKHVAGEIMFEFPDRMVYHADSFFIGQPVRALGIHDLLAPGETYFVLPIEAFACNVVLSASTLGSLGSSPGGRSPLIRFGQCPFQYLKGSDGRVVIKVIPEFIASLINGDQKEEYGGGSGSPSNSFLCSTPELQKHYQQLVGCKEQVWSPKLETISEHKIRFSPCRFIGLEWKMKE